MSKKAICLTDMDDQVRWFNEEDLLAQLSKVDLLPVTAAKTMIQRTVMEIRQMLDEDRPAKRKMLEDSIRGKLAHIVPTLDKMTA